MGWARSAGIGVAVGVLLSITPFEFFLAVPTLFALFAYSRIRRGRLLGDTRPLRETFLSSVLAVSIAGVAALLPFKYPDREHVSRPLESRCVTIARATQAAYWRSNQLPDALRQREICFTTLTPTLSEIQRALAAQGIEVEHRICASGATLLWGAYWMPPRLREASR